MKRRWTEDEIWGWYISREWISGCNFIPSTNANGVFCLFQEYGHEQAYRDAAKEIALVASASDA
ncbi:hypothetical protein KIH79_02485 [Bifidobacterium sp. 82T10]|uniref:Uncharacterized protein n=1 Tax=Bifidobacterium miconis TaxID=2834435 RepID=A0ABS6WF27_9BIFI|nr:hypothetical protein [Bifidobacterium miconis]MBW3091836.1 hypothetical protein [Bifidobacterium miconis]